MNQNCKNVSSFPNFDSFNRQWDSNVYISNLTIKQVRADGTRNTYHFHICVLTKVFAQPAANTILPDFDITICDTFLEQVDHFPYLDSLLSNKCTPEKEVEQNWSCTQGIWKANQTRLQQQTSELSNKNYGL